jgi:FkbM family methyltransferase
MALCWRIIHEWRGTVLLRPIGQARLIGAVLAVLALGIACERSGEGQRPEPSAESSSEAPSGVETVADPPGGGLVPKRKIGQDNMARIFEKIHEEHQSAEGREGILAEERLYSNFDEELIIRDFFQDRRDGFYLDVGCARPVKGSNTYYLEKHLGWTGIGVDALEEYAAAWKKERPNSRFLRHLVSDRSDVTEKFFRSYGRGLSSTDQKWASGKAFGVDFPTEELLLTTITLDDLLDREGVTKVDLLSMDIEGHEPKALAGFDIERFRPELVVVEGQPKSSNKRKIARYFKQHGYQRIEKYRPFDKVNDYYQPAKTPQK